MKYILIILISFLIAFATSLLFEWSFIAKNIIREGLVTILILIELLTGFLIFKKTVDEDN
jgi:hypothetical protein